MKKYGSIVVTALAMMLSPLAAHAQDANADTCGLTDHPELLKDVMTMMLGPWQVNHQAGFVVVGGMTMPFPNAGDNDTITFERSGNDLIATHPDMQEPMAFYLTNEAIGAYNARDAEHGIPTPPMTFEDIGLLMGCTAEDMPRLIGTTSVMLEGITMDFTWRVVIASTEMMYVVQHVEGVGAGYAYYSRRTVLLTR